MANDRTRSVRRQFPILETKAYNKPLVYLDNAATTQKPQAVIDALSEFYQTCNSNIHRGVYSISEKATALYEGVRARVRKFINAASVEEIVYTRSATEAINTVAYGWGIQNLKPGDTILITELEHHSNIVPWHMIAGYTGARLRAVRIAADGTLDMEHLETQLRDRPKILALTHISNVLGVVNPVKDIAALAHKNGAVVLVDAAQSVAHMKVDVQALDCDFMAFSSHKMYGPTGLGFLYGKRSLLEKMQPMLGGGDMIKEVRIDSFKPNDVPWKFEAGTMPIAEVVAFEKAIDFIESVGLEAIQEHDRKLTDYALKKLAEKPYLKIFGPGRGTSSIISMWADKYHPHDIATVIDRFGVCVRAGHHCAQPLMEKLGVPATLRASFAIYNTTEEIDTMCEALDFAKSFFSRNTRRTKRKTEESDEARQRI